LTSLTPDAALLAGGACSVPRHARCSCKISSLAARHRHMLSLVHFPPPLHCLGCSTPSTQRHSMRQSISAPQHEAVSSQQASVALPKMGPLCPSRQHAKLVHRCLVPCPRACSSTDGLHPDGARGAGVLCNNRRLQVHSPQYSGRHGPQSAAGAGRTGPSNAARPTTHCFQLVARRTVPCTSLPEPQAGP